MTVSLILEMQMMHGQYNRSFHISILNTQPIGQLQKFKQKCFGLKL